MKSPSVHAVIVVCALFAPVVSAQDPAPPAKPAMGMQMDKQMSQMQVNMKVMQQQMEKLRGATDPTERQKLLQEHMQTMQASMTMMRGMGGSMIMGSGQHGGMAMGDHQDMAGGEMMQRHGMMEARMDMLQMMMEQMMQHDQMMSPTPNK